MYDILGDIIFKLDKIVGDLYEFEPEKNIEDIQVN